MKISFLKKFCLACQAFIKAFKLPLEAESFLAPNTLPSSDHRDQSHLRLLTLLQQSSRAIDFFKEDINSFTDAQIGAASRKIHADCSKILEELVTIRPLMDEVEGTMIQVPAGYDPKKIKVIGKIKGEPPFTGYLVHRGWKAHKHSLPKGHSSAGNELLCPAEVEIR